MKKILSAFLALIILFSLCSCNTIDYNNVSEIQEMSDIASEDNVFDFTYYNLVIPEEYNGTYEFVESSEDEYMDLYNRVTLYESHSREISGDGLVFSILILTEEQKEEDYHMPGGLFGEIEIDGTTYYLRVVFPSDVQYEMEFQGYYHMLYNNRINLIYSIFSEDNEIKLYNSFKNEYESKITNEQFDNQIISVNSDDVNATLSLYETTNTSNEMLFTCPAKVGKEGVGFKTAEGTSQTPKGWFKILFAFSTGNIDTKIEVKTVKPDTIWIDDPKSIYYNTWQSTTASYADWSSYESIYNQFSNGTSSYGIAFDFNGDCTTANSATPGKGSVIFLDGRNGTLSPTYGDIVISADNMKQLLSLLDADKKPMIIIR